MTRPGKHLDHSLKKSMLCKQHLSKQEDKAQTWPCNTSADPGHTDCDSEAWYCRSSLQCPSSTPSCRAWGLFSLCRQSTPWESQEQDLLSSKRFSYLKHDLLPFLDEVRTYPRKSYPSYWERAHLPCITAHSSNTAAHKHVLVAQCACAQMQSEAEHAQLTEIPLL